MSNSQIIIKHNKHRIHPCPNDKKLSLVALLLEQNSTTNIVVVSSVDVEQIKEIAEPKNIVVINDDELAKSPDLMCDLLISYDLPSADIYMSRLSRAKDGAIILLDINEQKNLYPIETILKRVIRQDILVGYEYEPQEKMKIAQKIPQKEKSVYKFDPDASDKPSYEKKQTEYKKPFDKQKFDKPKWDKPKRDGESSERKPFDKPKRDGENSERKPFDKPKFDGEKKYDKSGKKPNKFLGKDENGKAKFSGKSGERNHKHDGKPRENIEAPKNVGRKITIKERKPKDESNS